MQQTAIQKRTIELLSNFRDKLPVTEYEDDYDLIVNGEWGVALENLCQQLFEHSIPVNPLLLGEIKTLTSEMNLSPKTWRFLDK